jgi:ribosomal protein S18 acetylase RimI-like enzyme
VDVSIRPYDPARDAAGVRACFVQLQDEERATFPDVAGGEELADPYLGWMHRRVAETDGAVFVAELGGAVVGFVSVLGRVQRDEPDDPDPVHASINALAILDGHRGNGLGARLVAAAEGHARKLGVPVLRVARHGGNDRAQAFYGRAGFEPIMVLLEKRVTP